MQQLFFRIAAIKIGSMAAINDRECSNKYLGKEQLIIGKAAINNQEQCGNYLLELQQERIKYR
jgi:hypothetical protein